MDYIKIRFGNEFSQISSSLNRVMEDIFRPRPVSPMFTSFERSWMPQMDMYETPEEIVVRAEIAGVDKENLQIEINSRAVKMSGLRKEMTSVPDGTYRLAEIQYGSFERILYLPAPIDPEVVSSTYAHGFLQIRMAKMSQGKTHQIPVTDE